MASAESNTIYRTYTQPDGTKKRTAFKVKVDFQYDANGKPTGFVQNLQNDLTAIDGGVTGGGVNASWTTGAKLMAGDGNVWKRQHRDPTQTDLGFVMPDDGWADLNDRGSNFSSQVNNTAAGALAKLFNGEGYGRTFGMDSQAGAALKLSDYLGTNKLGLSGDALSAPAGNPMRVTEQTAADKMEEGIGRKKYDQLYYPTALKYNRGQDRLQISVLKYEPRRQQNQNGKPVSYKLKDRASYTQRILGSCILPVPGGVGDTNMVSWGPDNMDPASLAIASATFEGLQQDNPVKGFMDQLEGTAHAAVGDKGAIKTALAGILTKEATGVGNILTRKTGAIVNPNMELLFNAPQLRPFAFTYRLSARSREESHMIKKIIRMFKQSMSVQRTKSQLFLKSPNTYKLTWLTQQGSQEHQFLPKIKEVALQGFNVNYTPDGNYATYEDSSMVAYEIQFNFTELEAVYNDDYQNLDGDKDESIGY